jgi:hypothetical protein
VSEPTIQQLESAVGELRDELRDVREQVRELRDRAEIAELTARYFHIVDEKEWVRWRELFTDDAQFHFGGAIVLEGADACVATVREILDGGRSPRGAFATCVRTRCRASKRHRRSSVGRSFSVTRTTSRA